MLYPKRGSGKRTYDESFNTAASQALFPIANDKEQVLMTEIFSAIDQKDASKLEKLLKEMPSLINKRDQHRSLTPLLYAFSIGFKSFSPEDSIKDKEILTTLIKLGANVQATDANKNGPLHMLFENADILNLEHAVEVTLMLLEKGCRLDYFNDQNKRPFDLMMAKAGSTENIPALIDYINFYSSSHPEIAQQYETEMKQMLSDLEEASLSNLLNKRVKLTHQYNSPSTSPSSLDEAEKDEKPRFVPSP